MIDLAFPDQIDGRSGAMVVRGERIITPEGEKRAAVHIRGGVIEEISDFENVPAGSAVLEAGHDVVLPGLVDTHVHINEPGRTEWEGFETATRAAAAGGVTTLIEMPLNSIPATTTAEAFHAKREAAEKKLRVDVGFWGGIVPGNASELRGLWEAGCFGFKCFLIESGVDEFGWVTEAALHSALPELASLGAPLLAHAEVPGPIESAKRFQSGNPSPRSYKTWLDSRPRASENDAITLLENLCAEFETRVHVVHLSSTDQVVSLDKQKSGGKLSVETCPHYLTFAAEEIADGATEFKCAPPIRERDNREKLWAALGDGIIDMIATDHSPCPPQMKLAEQGDFIQAWGGISSLQLSLSAVWTGARKRGYSLTHVAKWMCEAPAKLAGLNKKKGAIAPGFDADLSVFDPEARFCVKGAELQHRHKLTPYDGLELSGKVKKTILRGKLIFDQGKFCSERVGQILLRGKE